jgi:hypothetical protein
MELAFVGGFSQSEIKRKLDGAMDLYGLSKTADNYSRAGSVLVTLRKEYGPGEMAILDEMILLGSAGANLSFPDAAALAAVGLAADS